VARSGATSQLPGPREVRAAAGATSAGAGTAKTRLVGVSRGNPYSPHDFSGISLHLFNALERRYELVRRVDTRLPRWQRALVALTTFYPSRAWWAERYFKNLLAFRLLSRQSRLQLGAISQPYDVAIQLNGLFRTQGAPYTIYLDNTYHESARDWPGWNPLGGRQLERWYALERSLYHDALHLFAMSEFAARSLTGFYGVPQERVSVVGGGVNIEVLDGTRDPAPSRVPTILFVGKEFQRKGGDTLLKAFRRVRARVPEARLRIVGTEDVAPEPGVEVLGRIHDRSQIARLYAEATLFCLPSRFDPYPGALIEAMAYGLPCVSTTVCGIPEIVIAGQTGLLVPPGDDHALAGALLKLLTDGAVADRLGMAGRRRAEDCFDWDRVVERMAPVLDGLYGLGDRRATSAGDPGYPVLRREAAHSG
jgi:alpha-maltose-1-phosphate synthase